MKSFIAPIIDLLSLKKNPGYLVLVLAVFAGYVTLVATFPMLTFVTVLNIVIYIFLLLVLVLFLYYVSYRWVKPELIQQPFHRVIQFATAALMLSAGIGIWFVQNPDIFPWFENIINQVTGRILLQYPVVLYPVFTFLLFVVTLTPLFWAALHLLVKPLKIQQDTSKTIQLVAYLLLLVSATTCIFSTDFLEISPGQESDIYGGGTEDYVRYRIRDDEVSFLEDLRIHGGFLYGRGPNPTDPVHDYLSISGFYGTLLKLFQTTTKIDPEALIMSARIFFGFGTSVVLTALSFLLKKKFGIVPSLLFSAASACTFWFIGPSTHLLWVFPVMFIPLMIGVFLYPRVIQQTMSTKRFLFWVFIGQIFVFLHSYVYAPVMLLSAAVPPFFYNLMKQKKFREILLNGIIICLVGLLAMGLVMAVHLAQLTLYFDSAQEALAYFADRAEDRGVTNIKHTDSAAAVFRNWMQKVKVFYFSKQFKSIAWWDIEFKEDWNTFGNFHLFTGGLVLLSFLLKASANLGWVKADVLQKEIHTAFVLSLATIAATLSSWSWFPALGHMSDHYHMNGIMYMILMGVFVFALTGILLQTIIHLLVSIRQNQQAAV